MLRVLTAALAFAALLVTSGCGGGEDGGVSAEDIVRTSTEATGAVRTFHFTLDVENVPSTAVGLQLTGAEGDVVVPDRASADVTGTFAGTTIATQIVAIGEKVWLKNPLSGTWQSIDVSATPVALLDPAQGVLGVMQRVEDPADAGAEDVGGVTLRKVTGTAAASDVAPLVGVSPSDRQVPVTLWIGEEDFLLRRIEVRGPVAEGEPDDAQRIVEVSRFDEPVTIEQPEGTG